ncbi:substrate-binding domain-containing protein [Demequina sp. NBRC 110052]|uniref:substrate-binding domain-containing protein n=1 Tax=Demequina sp. NBRC 110052 TaxID=1570341 RepID=UPI0009FE744A|nr:substrate-binding domain-containing protein [Demequina sp. NBRC 110052]
MSRRTRKAVLPMVAIALVGTLAACSDGGTTTDDPTAPGGDGYVIGFSNSFNGNTFRQSMEAYAKEAAEELMATGEVSELIFAEANQDNNKQIQQIQSFILQGVDAIIIDPGSATALTGVVQEASDAGIPVITVNDGPIETDADGVYQIYFDAADQMNQLTTYIAEGIGGEGTIIELRGMEGDAFDAKAHEGVLDALENYPGITVAAEIYTDWTGSKAQSELAGVLPSLLQQYGSIDGVVTQGGDSYAAVQAFQQAGADLPMIGGDNRGFFLKWWANEAPEGYDTISVSANPWDGATAVYVAVDVLSGEYDIPSDMIHPIGIVTADEVDQYADVDDEAIAAPTYDREWVRSTLYN